MQNRWVFPLGFYNNYGAQLEKKRMKSGTDYSGFFPFGWLRGFQGDNWQIFWNKRTGHLFLKAAVKNTLIKIGEAPDWMEAKKKADFLMQNPDSITIETSDF